MILSQYQNLALDTFEIGLDLARLRGPHAGQVIEDTLGERLIAAAKCQVGDRDDGAQTYAEEHDENLRLDAEELHGSIS